MLRPGLILGTAALALSGCGSSSGSASTSSAAPAGAHAVIQAKMTGYAFTPATIHARVGQSVHWVNDDDAPHNVVGTSGPAFTGSPTFGHGGQFTLRLTRAGTIHFLCTVHPFMKGTIEVSG